MSKQHCHYHSSQPATWQCEPCNRHYGDCCVPLNADLEEYKPSCPLCQKSLLFLGAANTAQPFWERLPKFFQYALQRDPLLFAICIALASIFMPSVLVFWLLLWAIATKYLHSVIEAASSGTQTAPDLLEAFSLSALPAFFRQLAIFVVIFVLIYLAENSRSELIYWSVIVGITLALPVCLIRLSLEQSLVAALSPQGIGQIIQAMGWHYLILCVFLFILLESPGIVIEMLSGGLPLVVLKPIATLLLSYFLVVICALLGYIVFQYQGELGYTIAGEDLHEGFPEAEWRRRKALAEAEIRLKEGQGGAALSLLLEALRKAPEDLQLNERYHRLLLSVNARNDFFKHLLHYLPLAARLDAAQAVNAFLGARQLQADYRPEDPWVCERLAEVLLERHKTREALELLRDLHKRFPDYLGIPRAYLLAARGFAEGLGKIEPAQQLLAFIQKQYPAFEQMGEVVQLTATLQKLANS